MPFIAPWRVCRQLYYTLFRDMKRLLATALLLGLAINAWAFKVYVFVDMEGCTGITSREQVLNGEGALRMAEDINACVAACFKAGATSVVVRDGHGKGLNVDPKLIDKRAELIQGPTPNERFRNVDGSAAMILLGYHAMSLTPNAILAHSYDSKNTQALYLNGREIGEIGMDALIAAEHNVPVVMVSGADDACREAKEWIPGVVVCQVKRSTTTQSGVCLSAKKSHKLIACKVKQALAKRNRVAMVVPQYPAVLRREHIEKGSVRAYHPDFRRNPNPRVTEKVSERSVEQLIVGKSKRK